MTESTTAGALHDIQAIFGTLPHRYPFLMVDRVLECEPRKRIVCLKNVTANEPQFVGHFPGNPVMPGVLIAEALAQAGALLVLDVPEHNDKLVFLTGLEGAKFRRPVRPGDQLRLEVVLERIRRGFGRAVGRASVDGELAAEMTISFAVVDKPAKPGEPAGETDPRPEPD